MNLALEHSSTGRFANRIAKSSDLQSSAPRSISSKRETRVPWMGEIIVWLDGCSCFPRHNFNWKHAGASRVLPQSGQIQGHCRQRRSEGISCAGNDHCPTRFSIHMVRPSVFDTRPHPTNIHPQVTKHFFHRKDWAEDSCFHLICFPSTVLAFS